MMILTPLELEQLTQRQRPGWQARVLDGLNPPIPYRRRPDGTLIVLRIHVEGTQSTPRREPQLRLEA
jgi:hypothetical protein